MAGAAAAALLQSHELYELLPTHGKVVTLDADLPMKHALDALSSHSATCLPVWDSAQQRFVDVLSCADLVDIVLYAHRARNASDAHASAAGAPGSATAHMALERCHLRDLGGLQRSRPSAGFIMASVDDSMYHGCLMLTQHRLECLPLGDTSSSASLLHILLPEQVLAFVAASMKSVQPDADLLGSRLDQSVLPHCKPWHTAPTTSSLVDALAVISEHRLQALPLVDASNVLHDVISCRDAHTSDLTAPVDESLHCLAPTPVRLFTCCPTDTFAVALQRLANSDVPQLVCVDENRHVCGVITAADILAALLAAGAAPAA